MAEALVWHLIRDNNSFLVRRGRTGRDGEVQFSKEPGNVLNVNTFKYSGIANNKTIDIQPVVSDKKAKVALKKKTGKNLNKPAKSTETVVLSKFKDGSDALAALVKEGYRSDLAAAAKLRFSKLYKDARIKRKVVKAARPFTKRSKQ